MRQEVLNNGFLARVAFVVYKRRRYSMPQIYAGAFALMLVFMVYPQAHAQIEDSMAVKCIVGEAATQGVQGMRYLASALHNRGTIKGVYGCQVDRHETKTTLAIARQAWKEAKIKDVAQGAVNWENVNAFGAPYWVKSMQLVFEYKDHKFYKPRKRGHSHANHKTRSI